LPGTEHATHAPLQATLQHTPSVQKPEAQSLSFAHAAPRGFGPQLPATHLTPSAQSPSPVHPAKQAFIVGSQSYGAHSVSGPALHRPAPSHTPPPPTAAPSHVPVRQTVPAAWRRQAPAPSQVPSRPHVVGSAFGH
jgi:hypothetical protein